MQRGVPARPDSMPVRLHHIVAGAHDLPGPARFWTQAPGWMNLPEREIVIGTASCRSPIPRRSRTACTST
jgi:hypothetical protein